MILGHGIACFCAQRQQPCIYMSSAAACVWNDYQPWHALKQALQERATYAGVSTYQNGVCVVQMGDLLGQQHMQDIQTASARQRQSIAAPEPVWLSMFLMLLQAAQAGLSGEQAQQVAQALWRHYSRYARQSRQSYP